MRTRKPKATMAGIPRGKRARTVRRLRPRGRRPGELRSTFADFLAAIAGGWRASPRQKYGSRRNPSPYRGRPRWLDLLGLPVCKPRAVEASLPKARILSRRELAAEPWTDGSPMYDVTQIR